VAFEGTASAEAPQFSISRVKKKGSTWAGGGTRGMNSTTVYLAAVLGHSLEGKAIYQHQPMAGMAGREWLGRFAGGVQVQG